MSKLSPAQIEEAVALRETGHSYAWIGRRLGVSDSAISWHCLKHAADPPNARPIDKTIRGPLVTMRNGHQVRRFTPADDAELLGLEAQGLGYSEIARRMKRKPNTIRARLFTLARHDARNEAAA